MQYLTESQRLKSIEISLIRQVVQTAPPDAINLALGELGFPLPQLLRLKALEIMQSATPVYTPNAGLPELRSAIARQYPAAVPANVCVCNGVEEAVFVTLLSILNEGDVVAIPDPDYPAYNAICNMLGTSVIRLPYESDLLCVDWKKWEILLAQQVKVLILSNPSNPSGHVFSEQEQNQLIQLCKKYRITMVVDEIYQGLSFETKPVSFWGKFDAAIVLNGLSKTHCMSGWRLGWVISPQELNSSIIKARQYVSTCSNWLSQQLAIYALSDEGKQSAAEVLNELKECRELALNLLRPYLDRILIPQASPYLMLKVEGDDVEIGKNLARHGVVCVPGTAFGDASQGWLRINIAVPRDKLTTALEIICRELYLH